MRLIDADAITNSRELTKKIVSFELTPYIKVDDLLDFIDKLPTAYSVEKVVEDLEEYRANFDCRFCKYNKTEKAVCTKDCTDALIDGLLDILRKGGVE